jgi:hypothetical protein
MSSSRLYSYSNYNNILKSKLRGVINNIIKDANPDYFDYYVSHYLPIVSSYMNLDYNILSYRQLIEQFIKIKIINNYTQYNQTRNVTIPSFSPSLFKYDELLLPYGIHIVYDIIPETTCDTINYMLGSLNTNPKTQDVQFSLSNKDEIFGDMAPDFLNCMYTSILEEFNNNGINMKQKYQAIYTALRDINLNCYLKNDSAKDIVLIFFSDLEIEGRECISWAKPKPGYFKMNLKKGSIVVFSRDAYVNWSYSIKNNTGLIILT